jgi:hypothetical protein
MPPLVTDAEVKAVVDTQRDTTPFIATAHLLITEDLAASGLSTARLTQIELYLAAHFVALTEERGNLSEHTVGDATEKYSMKLGSGLSLTRYGQQAVNLDTSGKLRTLANEGQSAQFRVV